MTRDEYNSLKDHVEMMDTLKMVTTQLSSNNPELETTGYKVCVCAFKKGYQVGSVILPNNITTKILNLLRNELEEMEQQFKNL